MKRFGKEFKPGSRLVQLVPIYQEHVPKEVQEEVARNYSPGLDPISGKSIRGLTHEEEKAYMPAVIATSPDSSNWDERIDAYWDNFGDKFNATGRTLQVGYEEDGKPINLFEYCLYNAALKDQTVYAGANADDAPMGVFYRLVDLEAANQQKIEAEDFKEKADRAYIGLLDADNPEITIRHLLAANTRRVGKSIAEILEMTLDEMKVEMRKFRDADPKGFANNANSPKLEYKSVLYQAVEYGLITKLPSDDNYYMNNASQTKLGDLKQAITTLETNTTLYAQLVEDLNVLTTKGIIAED